MVIEIKESRNTDRYIKGSRRVLAVIQIEIKSRRVFTLFMSVSLLIEKCLSQTSWGKLGKMKARLGLGSQTASTRNSSHGIEYIIVKSDDLYEGTQTVWV